MKPKNQNRSAHHTPPDSQQCQHFPNGPISVICVPPAPSSEEEAEKKKQKRRKTIKFRVEIAGIVILLVYAFFTILIWCATKKAADAAKQSADAATLQSATAVKQLEISERAWIKTTFEGKIRTDVNG